MAFPRVLGLAALAVAACGPSTNTGDCADNLLSGDLVITEVFADAKAPPGGSGTDEGKEWFEIYNASDRPLDLAGLTITHSRPDGSRAKAHVMKAATIAPGQFFTLGNSTADLLPPYIDYGYSADLGDLFNTDGGLIALTCGKSEIDHATYDTVKEGHSRQLTAAQPPDYTLNDDPLAWCEATDSEFETANFGTPGSESDCTPVVVGQCNDNGTMRDTVPPQPGDLVITEVMPNPSVAADGDGEWFEIHAVNAFDLNGVGLDRAGDTANPNVITSPDCVHVAAGDNVVFAHKTDPVMNGGLPAASIKGTFTFAMVDGTAAAPGDVRVLVGTNVIDAVTWTSTRNGKAHALDAGQYDAGANDVESNFCDATEFYPMGATMGDTGSPGRMNPTCPPVAQPGQCTVNGTPRAIVKPAAGQLVITEFLANPANVTGFTDAQREWFTIKNTGTTPFDLNGLTLARTGQTGNLIAAAECKPLAADGIAIFARSNDPSVNGMIPRVDATFSFSLVDSNGNIEVRDGATVLDVITYPSVTSGVSKALSGAKTTTTDNDDPLNFCAGTGTYGDMSNLGIPDMGNPTCP